MEARPARTLPPGGGSTNPSPAPARPGLRTRPCGSRPARHVQAGATEGGEPGGSAGRRGGVRPVRWALRRGLAALGVPAGARSQLSSGRYWRSTALSLVELTGGVIVWRGLWDLADHLADALAGSSVAYDLAESAVGAAVIVAVGAVNVVLAAREQERELDGVGREGSPAGAGAARPEDGDPGGGSPAAGPGAPGGEPPAAESDDGGPVVARGPGLSNAAWRFSYLSEAGAAVNERALAAGEGRLIGAGVGWRPFRAYQEPGPGGVEGGGGGGGVAAGRARWVWERLGERDQARRARGLFQLLSSRRSVRCFSPDPVPLAVVEDCVRAAATAPSASHAQPWTFVIVRDAGAKRGLRDALGAIALAEGAPGDPASPRLGDAPYVVVVMERRGGGAGGAGGGAHPASESCAIATGILVAALHNANLCTAVTTPRGCDEEVTLGGDWRGPPRTPPAPGRGARAPVPALPRGPCPPARDPSGPSAPRVRAGPVGSGAAEQRARLCRAPSWLPLRRLYRPLPDGIRAEEAPRRSGHRRVNRTAGPPPHAAGAPRHLNPGFCGPCPFRDFPGHTRPRE